MAIKQRRLVFISVIATSVVSWFIAAQFGFPDPPQATPTEDGQVPLVRTIDSRALDYRPQFVISGETLAWRSVTLKPRYGGHLVKLHALEGDLVDAGAPICELESSEYQALVDARHASLIASEHALAGLEALARHQEISQQQRAEAEAQVAAARQQLAFAQQQLDDAVIAAPFTGKITQVARTGEFVDKGIPCTTLYDLSPLRLRVHVPETLIGFLKKGSTLDAQLVTGQTVEAEVTYIAPSADPSTRTFEVEASIENQNYELRAGVSARVLILGFPVKAHHLPTSALVITAAGDILIRTLDEDNIVSSHVVELISADTQGAWFTGLPDNTRVVVVGQYLTVDGGKARTISSTSNALEQE